MARRRPDLITFLILIFHEFDRQICQVTGFARFERLDVDPAINAISGGGLNAYRGTIRTVSGRTVSGRSSGLHGDSAPSVRPDLV